MVRLQWQVPKYRSMFPPNIIVVAGKPILETMTLQSQAALARKQWAQRCKHLLCAPSGCWWLLSPGQS